MKKVRFGFIEITGLRNPKAPAGKAPRMLEKTKNEGVSSRNMNEFTGAAFAASSFRACMGPKLREISDAKIASRTLQVTRRIISKGSGESGGRTFDVLANAARLVGFEGNLRNQFRMIFRATIDIYTNAERNTARLVVPPFNPMWQIPSASKANLFRLFLVVGVLSDFQCCDGLTAYEPVNPNLNGCTAMVESDYLWTHTILQKPLELVAFLPDMPVLPSTAGLVVTIGIQLFRVVNGVREVMGKGQAIQVARVF